MERLSSERKSSGAAAAPGTVFETVPLSSDSVFQRAVSLLHSSYLDSASEHGFQYSQVTLVKNDIFLNEYKTFYQQKKASNYTQEELQETHGFLLFETESQAKLACQRGLRVGTSTVTTLGDPAKGVYISKYSDYLHPRPWYHGKSGYVVIFNLIKYYLYELLGNTVTERPRQICPYVIVAFQYREPKKMAAPAYKSMLELGENVLSSPWKGKLIIQGHILCDITLWSTYGTVLPIQLPQELDFKYVIKVSSLKKRLPEAAFKKQNYLEQKVCCQDLCSSLYDVELSNRQGENIDKLTEYIKKNQLAIIKCLEDRGVFILLTSSALTSESDFEAEQMGLHGLHLFHFPLTAGVKDVKAEDDISMKVIPVLHTLNYALLEAKKSLPKEGAHPNTLVKSHFQEQSKVDKRPSLTAAPQGAIKEMAFSGTLSSDFDWVSPAEKCPSESLTQLKSYFSDPSSYILEVSTALDLLAEPPQSPCVSDGICDAGFSLVMTPDPEFLDSEAEVRKETETKKKSEVLKAKKGVVIPPSPARSLRVQPKRKASSPPRGPRRKVNLCRPFPKRAAPAADSGLDCPTTLKLVKGHFPQKRKRGAEVLSAQFVQKTKLDRKNQDAPISEDVPVATNTKRAKKREKSPVQTIPRAKPPVKKSPQKQRVNTVKGSQNLKIRKQPQPAKGETALQPQSEMSPACQEDGISINTVQPQSSTVAHRDLPENSIVNYASQALNMLADLALSSATSSTPASEPRNLCSSELPQNDVLLVKENSPQGTSDHEYHKEVQNPQGGVSPKQSPDNNSGPDFTISQGEENLGPCGQALTEAQSALTEGTLEPSYASQSFFICVEHSYALFLAHHSRKHRYQRAVAGIAFTRSGRKGPEARTPVGKVLPFRHQQTTSPLQKLPVDILVHHRSHLLSSSLKGFLCSHTVFSCDGSYKITFKCETEYAFSLDSKYTNNPLEKTVLRALHGPWNTSLPDSVEEVKLLLHMWVALFYSDQNKIIRSSRKVVEHSNPAKYVSINSMLESGELSEVEDVPNMERGSADPLSDTNEASQGPAPEVSFPDPRCLLPLIKPTSPRGLEFSMHNQQEEYHPDTPEGQSFLCSYSNEVIGRKAKQESSDKLETSNLMLSGIRNTKTNGSSIIPSEDGTLQPLDSIRVASYNGTVSQTTFTTTYSGIISQPAMPHYTTLENRVDIFHTTTPTKSGALQDLIQHSSPSGIHECQPSLKGKDDRGYIMINVEPVTFAVDKNAYAPVQTEVINRADQPTAFTKELVHLPSATSLRHPMSTLGTAQTQSLEDVSSLAVSGQTDTKYLCVSSQRRETLDKEVCSLQKEMPFPGLSLSHSAVAVQAPSSVKGSSYLSPNEEMKHSQDFFLQTQNLCGVSSEGIVEPSQVEVDLSSASPTLEEQYSLNCIAPSSSASDGPLELRKNARSDPNTENQDSELFNSVFIKHSTLSENREAVRLELSEEDSDIDLTLTISPPTSPREETPARETEQPQESLSSNLALQDTAEGTVKPEELVLPENRDMSSGYVSVYPTASEEPVENKEREGDRLQPVTVILSKENCTLEIAEEINVTSDFPFDSLIEEVSPASSPDALVPLEETRPYQAVSLCGLKHHGTQSAKSHGFSQFESRDLGVTEKENSFVGPTHPVGQNDFTQVQHVQSFAEVPLMMTDYPETKGGLALPGKVTQEVGQGKCDESLSVSEMVHSCGAELTQPALVAEYRGDLKLPLQKLVKSGNLFQPVSIENRNLELKRLVLESNELPFSPRKVMENKSLANTLVFSTAPGGMLDASSKQQTSPPSIRKTLLSSGVPTGLAAVAGAQAAQAHALPEVPAQGSSAECTVVTHCMCPVTVDPGFQTQELSVVKMACLLKNSETEVALHEETIDLGTVGPPPNTTALESKQKTIHLLQDTSQCVTEELLPSRVFPMYVGTCGNTANVSESSNREPSASCVPEPFNPPACGISEEHADCERAGQGHRLGAGLGAVHCEPLSVDSGLAPLGGCGNPKLDMEDSCTLRGSHTGRREDAATDSYGSSVNLDSSEHTNWSCSGWVPGKETNFPPRPWASTLKKEDKRMPCYIQIRDYRGIPRTYANFTITKEFKDTTKTLHSLSRHLNFTADCSLLSSWTSTWQVTNDLTQNTLDLEYLRFAHKIKQTVKKGGAQHPATSSGVFLKDSPLQAAVSTFPLTKTCEAPVEHPASRSRSPLLVTVVHSDSRQGQHRGGPLPRRLHRLPSFWKKRCDHSSNLINSQRNPTVSFHLNKLKYNSTLKDSRNDISLILNEYAEFNKVMKNSSQVVSRGRGLNVKSGEAARSPEMYLSCSRQSASYEDVITDLCTSLHIKLKSVMKEACNSTFLFHLIETEDKSFFVRTKNLLRKGGHTEIEPQHFCQASHGEDDTLIVIIRNEDISSHLHQIPSLLKLKHLPGVIFAGIDSPGDVLNHTYQELFQAGGFVVSDDKILEALTLVQLKEIMKILEKLNRNGRWKWLLHYRENKKLKEDVRVDSVAHKKSVILKSYQSANVIELLHYHQCDSQSSTKADVLECLINLQIQQTDARFAIFLTEKPTISREVFENSGILVTDVNNFIENILKVAAPFRSSYW
ncbi:protein TASOR 2 isoform X2 [Nycticebus coucang]|uniref:protein TASOR 2 isoform X2 n=1 Tax=Nycticebus coucang TaxID=9470 RepID=UPI00234DAFC4|nr:protein TASOR 2 isoform X2 [Nycticebus coucang]